MKGIIIAIGEMDLTEGFTRQLEIDFLPPLHEKKIITPSSG
jgi:hypothetical protein